MARPHLLTVAFAAGAEREAPLTWGQTAIWDVLRWLPEGGSGLNQLLRVTAPPDTGTNRVRAVLQTLMERHEVLRSAFLARDGSLLQQVRACGVLTAEVYEIPPGAGRAPTARVAEALRSRPFVLDTELPVRAAVFTRDNQVTEIVLAVSHMALDGWSLNLVQRELTALLQAGATAPTLPDAQQPVERAAWESSAAGLDRQRRSLAFWERHLREVPAEMLGGEGGAPVLEWSRLDSVRLARALWSLNFRYRIKPSTTLLAASALLLSAYQGTPEAALRLIVATRFRSEARHTVGALNQNALLRLPVGGGMFSELLRRAADAEFAAYQHSEYHPRLLDRLSADIGRDRGIPVDGYHFFNDVRYTARAGRPQAETGGGTALPALAGRITTPTEQIQAKGARTFLYLHELTPHAVLTMGMDRRFGAGLTSARFLTDLEALVTRVAESDCPVDDLWSSHAAGTAARRG
ncbi:condensation domain-containing protein [Streptacidiphilus cavernicola]|uniref:Condensation domain-containing protein n=1 Tax=Streptacidiphilus cavernicola TaxID=3342716 RepID=A0ABV6VZZ4_9ACTN